MRSDKRALRQEMQEQRRALSPEEKRMIDEGIFQNVISLESYQRAKTVFLYCSTAEEIDTLALMEDAWRAGKRVCVPLCTGGRGIMEARQIGSREDLVPGKFDIPEPVRTAPLVAPEEIDFCAVPCLAADPTGNRLGYGGGFYDRFLAKTAADTAILCAESRFLDALPAEGHDRLCDRIVTERRVHIAKQE